MSEEKVLTGKASIDRPWMKYYPEQLQNVSIPSSSVGAYLNEHIKDHDAPAIHYYGNEMTWNEMIKKIDAVAKSLKALGFGEGDFIPVFLQSVPEYIAILLAAEKIGAAVVCRDNTPEENAEAIQKTNSKVLFAHDYLSKEEETLFYETTQLERIILISPYNSADRGAIPENIQGVLEGRYPEEPADSEKNMTWDEFLALGCDYDGECDAPVDPSRVMFCAYTSGSTGDSKQVMHSADNVVGIIYQMGLGMPMLDIKLKWLHLILPPALVAATVAMMIHPLATNCLLILDPFCDVNDLDLEIMRYEPNLCPMIPMFMTTFINSTRIPDDYSLAHLFMVGGGAEAMNNRQIRDTQAFLNAHQCRSTYTIGYGQSEGGATYTLPNPAFPIEHCRYGMPMPASILAAFDENNEEVGYNEIGEICKFGPGNMVGYDDEESTAKVLQRHSDGRVWLHTCDYGYITEDGNVCILWRGLTKRFGNGYLFPLEMENRVAEIPGVKDNIFIVVPDAEHPGFHLPYAYVVLEEDAKFEDVEKAIYEALDIHQQPVKITVLSERPYFHFKTNRKGLIAEVLKA